MPGVAWRCWATSDVTPSDPRLVPPRVRVAPRLMLAAQPARSYDEDTRKRVIAAKAAREADMLTSIDGRITIEPGKRGGKPCVRGLRITVYDVLSWLAAGMTRDEILADYPDLSAEDIQACLRWAADKERAILTTAA